MCKCDRARGCNQRLCVCCGCSFMIISRAFHTAAHKSSKRSRRGRGARTRKALLSWHNYAAPSLFSQRIFQQRNEKQWGLHRGAQTHRWSRAYIRHQHTHDYERRRKKNYNTTRRMRMRAWNCDFPPSHSRGGLFRQTVALASFALGTQLLLLFHPGASSWHSISRNEWEKTICEADIRYDKRIT